MNNLLRCALFGMFILSLGSQSSWSMEAENHKNKRAKVTAQQQVTLEFQNPQPAAPVGIVIPQRDPQRYTPAEQARRAAIR